MNEQSSATGSICTREGSPLPAGGRVAASSTRRLLANKPLSAKELEVLRWAAEGKTVWEISRIRSISQATVKFHLRNIYGKLQVNNRVQAAGEAIKRGLCR
ncbi:helix-turn-helix transcriptional regulator [Pseudomonas sp. 15FMM2]|uniref:Helix-turn-helix transcriptional regulator n=1 Tax=Pseudomonas imrae TaxID=2992837 RepID=A0ACC7PB96_9PSED